MNRAESRMIATLITWAVVAVVMLVNWVRGKWNERRKVVCVMAEVADKRATAGSRGAKTCYVSFRPERDLSDMEFEVTETEYNAWRRGDRGPLSFRGWELISFRPEPRPEWPDDVPVGFCDEEESK